jgi:hypothetical protein
LFERGHAVSWGHAHVVPRETCLIALLATLLSARATTPEELTARLAEVDAQRSLRLVPNAPRASAADIHKVAGGAIVTQLLDSNSGSKAYGVALIPLSIGVFWAALNDETRHPGYTAVSYSELLSGRPCGSGRHVLQFLPVPMLSDRWWIGVLTKNAALMQATGGSVRELAFKSSVDPAEVTSASGKSMIAQGEPIGYTRGAWFMVAVDERHTYLEYFLHTDPGGSIPASMASMFASKGVRDNILALQRFATEAHPACPIE